MALITRKKADLKPIPDLTFDDLNSLRALTDQVEKRRFVPEMTARQPYDIWHFQDVLWVVDSFDQLESDFARWAKSHGLL